MNKKSIVMGILNDMEKNIKMGNIDETLNSMYDLANEYEEVVDIINDNIIDADQIDDLIAEKINNGVNWIGIKIILEGIKYNSDLYYHIDAYGNIEDLTIEHLEFMYEDIKYELTDILEEEE